MKTFETEKHNIPEGATHYFNENENEKFAWWNEDEALLLCPGNSGQWEPARGIDDVSSPIPIPQAKEVEWVNGLPPVGAIYVTEPHFEIELLCKYSSEYVVVGEMLPKETYKGMEVVIDLVNQRDRTFRKPETEAERVERERLENGQSLYELVQSLWCAVDSKYTPHPYGSPMVDDKTKEMYARLARAVDYRKESE